MKTTPLVAGVAEFLPDLVPDFNNLCCICAGGFAHPHSPTIPLIRISMSSNNKRNKKNKPKQSARSAEDLLTPAALEMEEPKGPAEAEPSDEDRPTSDETPVPVDMPIEQTASTLAGKLQGTPWISPCRCLISTSCTQLRPSRAPPWMPSHLRSHLRSLC